MVLSVSSEWIDASIEKNIAVHRKLLIGTSDYSDRVVKWGSITRETSVVKPAVAKVSLANADGVLNSFHESLSAIAKTITLSYGVEYRDPEFAQSGDFRYVPWKHGHALETVDGEGDFISIPASGDLITAMDQGNDFSFNVWFKPKGLPPNANGIIFGRSSGGTLTTGIQQYLSNGQPYCTIQESDGSAGGYLHASSMSEERYYMLTLTVGTSAWIGNYFRDASSISHINMNSDARPFSGDDYYLFAETSGFYNAFGAVAEARFYNKILTEEEITDLYNYPMGDGPNVPSSDNLLLYWTANDKTVEYADIFKGNLKKVNYNNQKVVLSAYDVIDDMADRVVGDSENVVTMSGWIPSDIAWTLCTCYGGLSSVSSTNNADIDYQSFLDWAAVFSADSITMTGRYSGQKVTEALSRLKHMTDSVIWGDTDGKLAFKRITAIDSKDSLITTDEAVNLEIDLDQTKMVNEQHVELLYSVNSDYWTGKVTSVHSTSMSAYGRREDIIRDDKIWFISSVDATNLAIRMTTRKADPVVDYNVVTGMIGTHRGVSETIRLVDSFYNISSDAGWMISQHKIMMDHGQVGMRLTKAVSLAGFYLDVNSLDEADVYLL